MTADRAVEAANTVLEAWAGRVSTHYDGCWQNHVACLAALTLHELTE